MMKNDLLRHGRLNFQEQCGCWGLQIVSPFLCSKGESVSKRINNLCPVERAGSLDNRVRRWVQDPQKIVGAFIEKGMTVVDVGCGPGFFTLDMARMVGATGHVIAVDVQDGMLAKLKDKIQGTELERHITLHTCSENKIGLSQLVDFVLAFYMAHEVSNQEEFFTEIHSMLKPEGKVLIVEPPIHVSKKAFGATVKIALAPGFKVLGHPKVFLSKTVLLQKMEEGK